MAIRCGTCKGAHPSIEAVRTCAANLYAIVRPASAKQRGLAQALARERARLADYAAMEQRAYHEMIDAFDYPECSRFIQAMLEQPRLETVSFGDFPEVAAGKYALRNEDGDVKFYQVAKILHEGKPRLVYNLIGAPGEFLRRRLYRADGVMAKIAADPKAAFALFGQEVGQCGVCSSPLTQKHTRERGVGDICWAKLNG